MFMQTPFTYTWSEALAPRPADWGSHIDIVRPSTQHLLQHSVISLQLQSSLGSPFVCRPLMLQFASPLAQPLDHTALPLMQQLISH